MQKSPSKLEKSGGATTHVERGWRLYGSFGCLALLNLVCAIDATILSVALPTIATSIPGTTAIEAFWCGTSFLVSSTVFQPSWAAFSHFLGRKNVLLAALSVFTTGTIIASLAHKIATLLVGRCVQGIGGGGLVSLTYVIMADVVTLRERGKWMSIISLQWAIGSVIGPVIGGAIAVKSTWRWIFWLNLPPCAIAGVAIPICLRLKTRKGSIWKKLGSFDWLGSFIFLVATTSFLVSISWGGIMYDWYSWRTIVPLTIGLVGLIVFVLYSTYFSPMPLIRRSLFNCPTAITAYFGTTVHGMLVWSLLYYMPLYFQVAKNATAITSGVTLFPLTFTIAPAAVAVGFIITNTGRYRPSLWVGWLLATTGIALLTRLEQSTSTASWICLTLVPGTGTGILFSAQGFSAFVSASNADLPFAGALYSFFRAFGQALGVAVSGTIFQNAFKSEIEATAYAANASSWASNVISLVQVVKGWNSEGDEGVMKELVIRAYVASLRAVWMWMSGLAWIAFLAALVLVEEISLDRKLDTDQGFRYDIDERNLEDEEKGRGDFEKA